MDILLKSCIIADSDDLNPKDILISDDMIKKINTCININADKVIDGQGKLVVFPGLMDMHVHLRDPGYTYKEDITTGCSAAAAGGFTAIACMPNTKPCIDNPEVIHYIFEKAELTGVNVYPIGCITKDMKGIELCNYKLFKDKGVIAVSDDGRPVENAEVMRKALIKADELSMPVISHCEDLSIINGGIINKGFISNRLNVKGMDRASEDSITAREIALSMATHAHIHIAHVSTYGAVEFIRNAKKAGHNVTCETCPHYFWYTEEKLLSKDADYRMNPPLRTEKDRKAILEAVVDGTIDCIVTDHAPHIEDEKSVFETAPNGVIGLETSFAATLTKLYHTGRMSLKQIATIMSVKPRIILGLDPVVIEEGSIADLCIADISEEWTVDKTKFHSKSSNSAFKNELLKGRVKYTISNGKIIYSDIKN